MIHKVHLQTTSLFPLTQACNVAEGTMNQILKTTLSQGTLTHPEVGYYQCGARGYRC